MLNLANICCVHGSCRKRELPCRKTGQILGHILSLEQSGGVSDGAKDSQFQAYTSQSAGRARVLCGEVGSNAATEVNILLKTLPETVQMFFFVRDY